MSKGGSEWHADTSFDRVLVVDIYGELSDVQQEDFINKRLQRLWDEWGSDAYDMTVRNLAVIRAGDYITVFLTVRISKEYRESWPDRPASFVPDLV